MSRTIAKSARHENVVKKSRFICSLGRVNDEAAARAFIAARKAEFWDASHNCSAWVIGERGDLQRSNDDGEPAGTAGTPILFALTQPHLTDVVAVVTRYFGGTLLGAGGLIRAYGHAVTDTVAQVGIVERISLQVVTVRTDHDLAGKLEYALRGTDYHLAGVDYLDQARFRLHMPEEALPGFTAWLSEATGGRYTPEITGVEIVEIPVTG